MGYLYFETEEQLCGATAHLVQPKAAVIPQSPKVRRHHRVALVSLFSVLRVQSETSEPEVMASLNLSEAGVFLQTEAQFNQDETLLLEFVSPSSRSTISLLGRVARQSREVHGEPHGIGVDFYELNDVQRRELRQLFKSDEAVVYAH